MSAAYNAPMNSVTDSLGCQYSVAASGQVTFDVVESGGMVTGTATTPAQIDIVVMGNKHPSSGTTGTLTATKQ